MPTKRVLNELVARQKAMHRAGEALELATRARDQAIYEATQGPEGLPKAEVARLLGLTRGTVYNAILRWEAWDGRGNGKA